MNYRKLTQDEIKSLLTRFGSKLDKSNDNELSKYQGYAKKYYPSETVSFLVSYNSEYNDEGYDVSVQYVAAYDVNGNELLPLKDTAKEAREKWSDTFYRECTSNYGSFQEPVDDLVINLVKPKLPELYVKE